MVPEARRKVFGIVIIVALLTACIVFAVLFFGNIFDTDEKKSLTNDEQQSKETATNNTATNDTTSLKDKYSKAKQEKDEIQSTTVYTTTTSETITTTADENEDVQYEIQLNFSPNVSRSSGVVYIHARGQFGFVCSDGYDDNAALVTCRELGFRHGFAYNLMRKGPYEHYTRVDPILSGINCTGSENWLRECQGFHLTNETETCTWFAAAFCYQDEPYELRLLNGSYPDSGLVEMRVGGEWRLFCAIRAFDDDVADILCRMMNYTGGLALDPGTLGPTSHTKVWVPYIYCGPGPEIKQSIFECELILHPENILVDYQDFRSNRYNHEYMSCYGNENSFAAMVHCLGKPT